MTRLKRFRTRIDHDLEMLYREVSTAMIKGTIYHVSLIEHGEKQLTDESFEKYLKFLDENEIDEAQITHWCERFGLASMLPLIDQEIQFRGYLIYSLLLVWMWGAAESKFNDVFHNFVFADPEVLKNHAFSKIKLGVPALLEGKTKTDTYRAILGEYRKTSGAYQEKGIERFQAIFRSVGLDEDVPKVVREIFLEMSEVRHSLVHRMGVVDEKLVEALPQAKGQYKVGTRMAVQREFVQASVHAIKYYALDIDIRIRKHFKELPPASALQSRDFHLAMLEGRTEGLVCPGSLMKTKRAPTEQLDTEEQPDPAGDGNGQANGFKPPEFPPTERSA